MIIAKTKLFIRFLLGLIFLYNQHMSFNTWETNFFFISLHTNLNLLYHYRSAVRHNLKTKYNTYITTKNQKHSQPLTHLRNPPKQAPFPQLIKLTQDA